MSLLFITLHHLTIQPLRRRLVERIARKLGTTRRTAKNIARHF